MNITKLKKGENYTVSAFYSNTKNPIPFVAQYGGMIFDHKDFVQTGVDILLTFDKEYFIDTVAFDTRKPSAIYSAAILSDKERLNFTKNVEKTTALDIVRNVKSLTVRLEGNFDQISITDIRVYGSDSDKKYIYPTPDVYEWQGNTNINLSSLKIIPQADADAEFAAELIEKRSDFELGDESANLTLTIEKDATCPLEGYTLTLSGDKGGVLTASDRRGFVYGVEAFLQLCSDGFIANAHIEDTPYLARRGIHVGVPSMRQMPFFKSFIENVVAPLHYNQVIIEVGAGMEYKSHPEINKMWETIKENVDKGIWPMAPHLYIAEGSYLKQTEMRELVQFIKSFGIDVIPELNSLSHVQYMTAAHPDVAEVKNEIDTKSVDLRTGDPAYDNFYPHCYCPSNPKSYEILFDLVDEIIDVFEPEIMHMGHDEVYDYGKCEKCLGKHVEVFVQDIIKIHAHLKEKGVRMALWGDMMNDVNRYCIPESMDLIPKDILLLDFIWYFAFDKDTERRLADAGFEVEIGNLYSSHFPRYKERMAYPGVTGGQISTWVSNDEDTLAFEGKIFDIMFTSDLLCNKFHYFETPRAYSRIINDLQQKRRLHIHNLNYDRASNCTQYITEGTEKAWHKHLDFVCPESITMPTGLKVNNNSCIISDALCFKNLDFSAERLAFLWSLDGAHLRPAWQKPLPIGKLTVEYTDGSVFERTLLYGVDIYDVNTHYGQPLRGAYYRHEGYCGTWSVDCAFEAISNSGDNGTIYCREIAIDKSKTVTKINITSDINCPDILFYGLCVIE